MVIVTRQRIQLVINCGWWQQQRLALKGISTPEKIMALELWLDNDNACGFLPQSIYLGKTVYAFEDSDASKLASMQPHRNNRTCGWAERRDQVLNYLTALSRGGLIEPLVPAVYVYSFRVGGTINFKLVQVRR
jgi:hypothetical protein